MSTNQSVLSTELIKAIQDGVQTRPIGVTDTEPFLTRQVYNPPVPPTNPLAAELTINTLQGIVDYLNNDAEFDDVIKDKLAIHVVSEAEVRLVGPLRGYHRQRETLVAAKYSTVIGMTFKFGTFVPNEHFIIFLRSLFVATPDVDAILQTVGRMTSESVKSFEDDGITQTVTARKGAATVGNVNLPTTLNLRPYRTFREIEQPESPFFLRVRDNDDEERVPDCALFETDGGQWKLTAIESIRDFFESAMTEWETKIPIIA